MDETTENKSTLSDVGVMSELPELLIDENTNIEITMVITDSSGKEHAVVKSLPIYDELAMEILADIGYGEIGWERYNVVKKVPPSFFTIED
jgi:hypothetical protein